MEVIAQVERQRTVPAMTTSRTDTSPSPTPERGDQRRSVGHSWTDWLAKLAASPVSVRHVRILRVSSSSRAVFKANFGASLAAAETTNADVAAARAVGVGIIENGPVADELRAQHGTFTLRVSSLEGGAHSNRLLGYATVFGETLFIYLMGSAAEGNLKVSKHQEDWLNAATEVVRNAIRHLAPAAGGDQLNLHWAEETRVARSDQAAAAIQKTMESHRVRLHLRGAEYDVANQKMVIRILLGMAADDRERVVDRFTRGKAALLLVNSFPEDDRVGVPFTHEGAVRDGFDVRGHRIRIEEPHELAVRGGSVEALQAIVRRVIRVGEVARGVDRPIPWDRLGRWAGQRHGLTSRRPEDIKVHPEGLGLHHLKGPGTALRRALGPRYVQAWRTERMPVDVAFPVVTDLIEQLENTGRRNKKGNVIFRGYVDTPVPDGGWGLTDDEWDRLEHVLAPRSPLAGRALGDWKTPFNTSDNWIEGTKQRWMDVTNGTALQVRERPAAERDRAFGATSSTALIAFHYAHLYKDIADELERTLTELQDQNIALEVGDREELEHEADERRSALEQRIEQLRGAVRDHALDEEAFAASGRAATTKERRDSYQAKEEGARTQREDALAELAEVEASLDHAATTTSERAPVDFSTLEMIVAGLRHDWGHGPRLPRALADAVVALMRHSFRIESVDHGLRAAWTARVRVRLDSGEVGSVPISGVVTCSQQNRSGRRGRDPMILIERRFDDDASFADLGELWGVNGSGSKNSQLFRLMSETLESGIDSRGIPTALGRRLLLCTAPPALRRAIWSWMTGAEESAPDSAFRDHVASVYADPELCWTETWVARDHTAQRRAMSLLLDEDDPGQGLPLLSAASDLRLTYRKAAEQLAQHRRSRSCASQQPPPFTTNWTRTDRVPVGDRRLFAKECQNLKCPGRGGGAGGRAARATLVLCSHVLWVPENPEGVLCPACGEAPGLPGLAFPSEYNQWWNKVTRTRVEVVTR